MLLLRSLLNSRHSLFWVIFHVILGDLATISKYPVIIWFYLSFIIIFLSMIGARKGKYILASGLIYLGAFEVLARMSECYPLIPYELGKYFSFVLPILGLLIYGTNMKRGWVGLIILVFLIPSFLFDLSGQVTFNDIRFNLLGIINIAIGILFFSSLEVTSSQLVRLLRLLLFPTIAVLYYTYKETPDFSELEFSLGANFLAAGGFGSNQVSTVLGLGVFLMSVMILLGYKITHNRLIDILLLGGFAMQGLLTFSRGGMIGGVMAIGVVIYYLAQMPLQDRIKLGITNLRKLIFSLVIFIGIFAIVGNVLTEGQLFLRYQGETAGTLEGNSEKGLSKITSGRSDIFLADCKLWQENFVFGVGAAASKYLRNSHKNVVAHVELSRLIAEHGLLGAIVFLLLLIFFFQRISCCPDNISKALIAGIFFIALFTTFHAATRTFLSPLLISIGAVTIKKILIYERKIQTETS